MMRGDALVSGWASSAVMMTSLDGQCTEALLLSLLRCAQYDCKEERGRREEASASLSFTFGRASHRRLGLANGWRSICFYRARTILIGGSRQEPKQQQQQQKPSNIIPPWVLTCKISLVRCSMMPRWASTLPSLTCARGSCGTMHG